MFRKIKHLIFVLLVIIASSNTPTYALQTIQAGEYSISYKGGRFDKSTMQGNLTSVTVYHHQTKIASAKSVSINHNLKEGVEEKRFTLSFENLYFQFDFPSQSDNQSPKLNKIKANVGSANIKASLYSDRAHLHDMELSDVKMDWVTSGFGASLKKFSSSDFVFGFETPKNSQEIGNSFGVALGGDIGEWLLEDLKITFGKGFQNKIELLSAPYSTASNCWGYTILIQEVPSHVCSSSVNNISINKKAIEQLFPEFAKALSQNGVNNLKLDWAAETSIKTVKDSYNIELIHTAKVENFGAFKLKSDVSTNQRLFAEMVALEKRLPSGEDNQTIYLNKLLPYLDMTFLHEYNVTIEDHGLLNIFQSFIKNKSPAFSQMSRYQLSVEAEKMITEALKGQPGLSDMLNPSISRFINGAGEISLTINPQGEMSVYERVKLISDFDDFIAMFNVRLVN